VSTAVLGGGRGPADQVRLVPWGDERIPGADPEPPWPGRLLQPAPTLVPTTRPRAEVVDTDGVPVGVTGWHLLTGIPDRVDGREIRGWAGPWPVVERWWEPDGGRRVVRMQVLLAGDGGEKALLLLRDGGRWLVEGEYD
jgi:protein ImuB